MVARMTIGIPVSRLVALAALLLLVQDPAPPPGATPPPAPVAVSVFEVRARDATAIDTRRRSYSFAFEVVRAVDDPEVRVADARARSGREQTASTLAFRCYQGSDVQDGKDSASRLLSLLDAQAGERVDGAAVERPFTLGDVGALRVTILRRAPPEDELWIFERADGRRATIAPRRRRP